MGHEVLGIRNHVNFFKSAIFCDRWMTMKRGLPPPTDGSFRACKNRHSQEHFFSPSLLCVFLISPPFSQVIVLPVMCKREVGNSFILKGQLLQVFC